MGVSEGTVAASEIEQQSSSDAGTRHVVVETQPETDAGADAVADADARAYVDKAAKMAWRRALKAEAKRHL